MNPSNFLRRTLLLAGLMLAFLAAGCGGSDSPGERSQSGLEAPEILSATVTGQTGRSLSGLPTGVLLEWTRVDDPAVQGYNVYRDTEPIPDGSQGDTSLRANTGGPVEQPDSSPVTHEDTNFNDGPEIGTTYHYRVSTVDTDDVEGPLSEELTVTISEHSVGNIDPTAALCGETLTVNGDNFGVFDSETDEVLFADPAGGSGISAPINNWQQEEIEVTVPPGAGSGAVDVNIAGTVASSDNSFTPESPLLSGTGGSAHEPGDVLTVNGDNLTPNENLALSLSPDLEFAPSDPEIQSWEAGSVELELPEAMDGAGEVAVIDTAAGEACRESNTVEFLVRPRLDALSSDVIFPGETLTLTGARFGPEESSGKVVRIGGQDVTEYQSWSDTEVTVTVPDGIPDTGEVVVDNNGVMSDGLEYTQDEPLSLTINAPEDGAVLSEQTPLEFSFSGGPESLSLLVNGDPQDSDDSPGDSGDSSFPLDPADFTHQGFDIAVQAERRGLTVSDERRLYFDVLPGDFDGSDEVGQSDYDRLSQLLETADGDPEYSPLIDTNDDGVLDERDAAEVALNFGATRSGSGE